MLYICPRCGRRFRVKPPEGTCPQCNAALVPERGSHELDHVPDSSRPLPPRRRFSLWRGPLVGSCSTGRRSLDRGPMRDSVGL